MKLAVFINSALVSAQNRQRLYWVGKRNADGTYSKVNVEQPIDRGILLSDLKKISLKMVMLTEKKHTVLNTKQATQGTISKSTILKSNLNPSIPRQTKSATHLKHNITKTELPTLLLIKVLMQQRLPNL